MRNAQHLLRIVLMATVGVLVAVPVAGALMADPFGPSEIADPTWQPRPLFVDTAPVLGVDGAGNALLGTLARNAQGNEQLAVYERCGSGPATWTRTLLGTPVQNFLPVGLKVANDGTAMAHLASDGRRRPDALFVDAPARRRVGRAAGDRRRPGCRLRAVRAQRQRERDRHVGRLLAGRDVGVDTARRWRVGRLRSRSRDGKPATRSR